MLGALAAGRYSRSPYIWAAAVILALNWLGSFILWRIGAGRVGWGYTVVNIATMLYFLRRWMEPNGQHRQFHFALVATHLVAIAFFAFQFLFKDVFPQVAVFSSRWWQLMNNGTFLLQLAGVIVYALLFRRAKADPAKWKADTEAWLANREKRKQEQDEKRRRASVDDV